VHRDFKPCNLLVDHSGRVKITDLGVAAELDSSMVKCTTFVGTFLYMSPERFGSEPYSFPIVSLEYVRVCACVWCVGIYIGPSHTPFPSDIWNTYMCVCVCVCVCARACVVCVCI
jgi:serine/threonine protein kinase